MIQAIEVEKARQQLAAALRLARRNAGITGAVLSRQCNISISKLSKIERGRIVVSMEDARRIVENLELSEDLASELLELAQMAQGPAFLTKPDPSPVEREERYSAYERVARTYRYFDFYINGLLQIPQYARSLLASVVTEISSGEINKKVVARLQRQAMLGDLDRSFQFLLSETALRAELGDSNLMVSELDHLLRVMGAENVEVRVLPATLLTIGFSTMYAIFDETCVLEEGVLFDVEVHSTESVRRYVQRFDEAWGSAMSGDQARSIVTAYRDHFRNGPGTADIRSPRLETVMT